MLDYNLVDYYELGMHDKVVASILEEAKKKLIHHMKDNKSIRKNVIIIDIDDTAINNYYFFKDNNFIDTIEVWDMLTEKQDLPAVFPILDFYNFCIFNKFSIIFISARLFRYYKATQALLNNASYYIYDALYLLPKNVTNYKDSPHNFKENLRKKLILSGYNILMNIGDQKSDLEGGYAKYHIKIPNYLYGDQEYARS